MHQDIFIMQGIDKINLCLCLTARCHLQETVYLCVYYVGHNEKCPYAIPRDSI